MAAAVTMKLLLLVVVMLLSSNLVESEPIIAPPPPPPSKLPNFQSSEKYDLQTIQECTSSFLDVKQCLAELYNIFHGGAGGGLPGGGPPEGGGAGPPDDGYGGGGGLLEGMGSGLPGIGGGLPGIGGGNIISPVCCKAITAIKKNCWPMISPNPIVAPTINRICGPPS